MKAKEVGKLIAVSSISLGLGAAGIFNLAACGYGSIENHEESESFDPGDNNAVCEYGVVEIDESDLGVLEETNPYINGILETEDAPIYAEPVEVYGPAPDDLFEESIEETKEESEEFYPSLEEVPAVYGVQETYVEE